MRYISLILATVVGFTFSTATAQGTSKWVYFGPDHRLHYATDDHGNRIMDFSYAGYKGGGVAMPVVAAVQVLPPREGDNTARIQAAIDDVSNREPDANGLRGAVLLEPGTFEVSGTLTISHSGVVLRGSGSGEGGTVIRMRGQPHRLLNIRGSGTWQADEEPVAITDAYVPSGASSFTVRFADADKFRPGDTVLIRRPVTEAWVRFMGMDDETLSRNGKKGTWLRPGTSINADRIVKSVSGYRITSMFRSAIPMTQNISHRWTPRLCSTNFPAGSAISALNRCVLSRRRKQAHGANTVCSA